MAATSSASCHPLHPTDLPTGFGGPGGSSSSNDGSDGDEPRHGRRVSFAPRGTRRASAGGAVEHVSPSAGGAVEHVSPSASGRRRWSLGSDLPDGEDAKCQRIAELRSRLAAAMEERDELATRLRVRGG